MLADMRMNVVFAQSVAFYIQQSLTDLVEISQWQNIYCDVQIFHRSRDTYAP